MRIDDVRVVLYQWELPPLPAAYLGPFRGGTVDVGVLVIRTDDGLEGNALLGDANGGGPEQGRAVVTHLKPALIGRDAWDHGAIWADLWRRSRWAGTLAVSAVDLALWDLAGKAAGVPVHRLLGTCRDKVPVYAASPNLRQINDYAEDAVRIRESGRWHGYKIHPHGRADEDIAICAAVKEAVGDDLPLMLDSFGSYDYLDALRVGQAIQELGFVWFEDPLAWDDLNGYVKLKSKLSIPLLATETTPGGLYNYVPWLLERATDMLRGDAPLKGGITPLVKIARLAEAFRMRFEIHDAFNSTDHVANLQVTMAVPNCHSYEVLLPFDTRNHGLTAYPQIDDQGYLHAPSGPGLGVEIDWDTVKATTTAELD